MSHSKDKGSAKNTLIKIRYFDDKHTNKLGPDIFNTEFDRTLQGPRTKYYLLFLVTNVPKFILGPLDANLKLMEPNIEKQFPTQRITGFCDRCTYIYTWVRRFVTDTLTFIFGPDVL